MSEPVVEVVPLSICGGILAVKNSDGSRTERNMSDSEHEMFARLRTFIMTDVHGVWHEFVSQVRDSGLDGYDLMCRAEEFRETHPDWVSIASVDDDHHMSSSLVFVRHGTAENYMGVSVVYVPQRGGGCHEFFLYPGHAESVLASLAETTPLHIPEELLIDSYDPEIDVAKEHRKPSAFDFFHDRWRNNPWYARMGFDPEAPVDPS